MPDATPDQPKDSQHPRRDGYDKANTLILACTLVAAGLAAGFTGWQASIAHDQERRTLRAYVVLDAELVAQRDTGQPVIHFKVENMGQTPVYDLYFDLRMSLAQPLYNGPPAEPAVVVDCSRPRLFVESSAGNTFSKTSSYETEPMWSDPDIETIASLFQREAKPAVFGTACYRDVFNRWHTIRMCYQWYNADQSPHKCNKQDGADAAP